MLGKNETGRTDEKGTARKGYCFRWEWALFSGGTETNFSRVAITCRHLCAAPVSAGA